MFDSRRALATILAAGALLGTGAASAQTFPQDAAWLPLTSNGVPIGDPAGDEQPARDIVGDAASPAAYVASDSANLFFRLRIDKTVLQGGGTYKAHGWTCLIDTDGDLAAYELSAGVDGANNPDIVELRRNEPQQSTGDPQDPAELLLASYPPATHAREAPATSMFGGDADVFIDWAVDNTDLVAAGITAGAPLIFICGTSNGAQSLAADLITASGGTTLTDLGTDRVICDKTGCQKSGGCAGEGDFCSAGVGECLVTGIIVCDVDGEPVCDAMAGTPVAEVCGDGEDNDCDGTVDNGCPDTSNPCEEDGGCDPEKHIVATGSGIFCAASRSTGSPSTGGRAAWALLAALGAMIARRRRAHS